MTAFILAELDFAFTRQPSDGGIQLSVSKPGRFFQFLIFPTAVITIQYAPDDT